MNRLTAFGSGLIGFFLYFSVTANATELKKLGPPQDEVMKFALDFRKAVLGHDIPFLKEIASNAGGVDQETLKFIYGNDAAPGPRTGYEKSVAEILSSDQIGIGYESTKVPTGERAGGKQYFLLFSQPRDRES